MCVSFNNFAMAFCPVLFNIQYKSFHFIKAVWIALFDACFQLLFGCLSIRAELPETFLFGIFRL